MKNVVEAYIGIWVILIILYVCLGFTSINVNVTQARTIANDIKAQVRASDGAIIKIGDSATYNSKNSGITLKDNGYEFKYTVTRQSVYVDKDGKTIYGNSIKDSTFKYGDIYKLELDYEYAVPLFGKQSFPIKMMIY